MAASPSPVSSLLSRIQDVASSSKDVEDDQAARATLLQLSRELTASLEQPDEVVSLVAFSGGRNMCVRVADDLKLFDLLCERSPRSAHDLAEATGAEPGLITRLLRTLVGMGFAAQVGRDEFAPTAVSKQMTLRSVRAGVRFLYHSPPPATPGTVGLTLHSYETGLPVLATMPAYFKANGYRQPRAMNDGPFQFTHDTTDDFYTFAGKQPGVMENFSAFMQGLFGTPSRLGWTDWFPVDEACLDGFDPAQGEYCFVDVGGGKGHEAQLVRRKYPDARGKFVVEDLPFVINDISDLDPSVERLPHDFTTPQPIKGARVYFLQNILHNWASPVCQTILSHVRDAMSPGYSRLLIGNIILAESDVPLRNSGLDIAMLYLHSGAQRSESEWRELVESAGLTVVKVWRPPGDGDGIVEVERPA